MNEIIDELQHIESRVSCEFMMLTHSCLSTDLCVVFICAFLQRFKYVTSITNYIEWVIYVSALVFVFPVCACKAHYKPEAAAFSLFFAWLNLVLYFRR